MKGLFSLSLLPLLTAASPILVDTIHNGVAPVLSSTNAAEVPDSYIVVLKKDATLDSALAHQSWVQNLHAASSELTKTELRKRSLTDDFSTLGGLKHTYSIPGSFMGYSGHFHEDVIEQVRRSPEVSRFPNSWHAKASYLLIYLFRSTTSRRTRRFTLWRMMSQRSRRTLHGVWPVSLTGTA